MKLTDTQLVLLSAASQREDGAVVLAPNLKGGAAGCRRSSANRRGNQHDASGSPCPA